MGILISKTAETQERDNGVESKKDNINRQKVIGRLVCRENEIVKK